MTMLRIATGVAGQFAFRHSFHIYGGRPLWGKGWTTRDVMNRPAPRHGVYVAPKTGKGYPCLLRHGPISPSSSRQVRRAAARAQQYRNG